MVVLDSGCHCLPQRLALMFLSAVFHTGLIMHMQASLKQEKYLIAKGGFQVAIVSNNNPLALDVGRRVFKGFLDLAIAPHASMGNSIIQQMRIGLELKHTGEQKLAHARAKGI